MVALENLVQQSLLELGVEEILVLAPAEDVVILENKGDLHPQPPLPPLHEARRHGMHVRPTLLAGVQVEHPEWQGSVAFTWACLLSAAVARQWWSLELGASGLGALPMPDPPDWRRPRSCGPPWGGTAGATDPLAPLPWRHGGLVSSSVEVSLSTSWMGTPTIEGSTSELALAPPSTQ